MGTAPEDLGSRFAAYIEEVRNVWAGGRAESARRVADAMRRMLRETPSDAPWVRQIVEGQLARHEMYRDADFGFLQMGHFIHPGHRRPPHDHGPYWAVYGVYSGEMEIPTYRLLTDTATPEARMSRIASERLTAGTVQVYLPGAIHSTRTLSADGLIVLRFLSGDIDQVNVARYAWEQVVA